MPALSVAQLKVSDALHISSCWTRCQRSSNPPHLQQQGPIVPWESPTSNKAQNTWDSMLSFHAWTVSMHHLHLILASAPLAILLCFLQLDYSTQQIYYTTAPVLHYLDRLYQERVLLSFQWLSTHQGNHREEKELTSSQWRHATNIQVSRKHWRESQIPVVLLCMQEPKHYIPDGKLKQKPAESEFLYLFLEPEGSLFCVQKENIDFGSTVYTLQGSKSLPAAPSSLLL